MTKTASIFLAMAMTIALACLAGCVSTTTGSALPEPDQRDAATANFQLGIRYFQNGNYDLARDRLQQSLKIDPKQAVVWSTLGATYEMLDNTRLAEEAHDKAINLAPRNFDVQNAYAVFLCRQKRFDDAETQLDRSIRAATNDNPEVMMTNAGVCMMQKPDYVKAEDYFRQALDRRPNHSEALLQMAVLKHAVGNDLQARAFLQRYRDTNRDSAGVLYLCALVEQELGDERARAECADKLRRDFPRSSEAKKLESAG
ncbi:MAG TPA: type IV pilus biogenesis/stability protein PilW [Woeseiaceae bacterium]|nr:type IV pilus biogenesis/stability protein PilW [Woeseiaceae bacterium]